MGKTSVESRLNMPGKWAWAGMEAPGFLLLGGIMYVLPGRVLGGEALPWENWGMAGLFVGFFFFFFLCELENTFPFTRVFFSCEKNQARPNTHKNRRSTISIEPFSLLSSSILPCRPSTPSSSLPPLAFSSATPPAWVVGWPGTGP